MSASTRAAPQDPRKSAEAPTPRLWRKILIATAIGALVFAGLSLYGDVQALRQNLSAYSWEMFALAISLATGNYLLRFLRWQFYLKRIECPVPSGESLLIFLSGFVMSVTPGKVGEVFKSLLLLEARGYSVVKTAPVVVAERLTDLLALVILTAIGALSFPAGVPIAIAGAAVVGVVIAASAVRRFADFGFAIMSRIPILKRIVPRLREAYESLHALTRPATLAYATLLSTAAWGLEVVALGVILRGFPGVTLGWEATSFAYSASTIAGALAMMPGGLGVTEAGMTGLLGALGDAAMTPAVATAATMLVRLATLWWAVLVGVMALGLYRRRPRVSGSPNSS